MEVSPWKRASVARSLAVSLGLEWKLPDHKTASLCVQKPLAHSWQVRPLIHALFRKDSCLKGRRTAPSKWLASLQFRDRLAGGKEIGIHRRHSSDFGKGVHWKACQRSSSKFWSLHGLREWRWDMSTNLNSFWIYWLHTLWIKWTDRSCMATLSCHRWIRIDRYQVVELSDRLHTLLLLPWLQANRWKEVHGDPWGRKRSLKSLLRAECWSFCTCAFRYRDCLYDKTMAEVACLFWCSIYVLPQCKWLVRPCIYSVRMLWLASIRFCFLSAFLFCFRSLAWDWWKNWTRNKELNWSSLKVYWRKDNCEEVCQISSPRH